MTHLSILQNRVWVKSHHSLLHSAFCHCLFCLTYPCSKGLGLSLTFASQIPNKSRGTQPVLSLDSDHAAEDISLICEMTVWYFLTCPSAIHHSFSDFGSLHLVAEGGLVLWSGAAIQYGTNIWTNIHTTYFGSKNYCCFIFGQLHDWYPAVSLMVKWLCVL